MPFTLALAGGATPRYSRRRSRPRGCASVAVDVVPDAALPVDARAADAAARPHRARTDHAVVRLPDGPVARLGLRSLPACRHRLSDARDRAAAAAGRDHAARTTMRSPAATTPIWRACASYQPGDPLQRVAWKAVARGAGWHTKQFEGGGGGGPVRSQLGCAAGRARLRRRGSRGSPPGCWPPSARRGPFALTAAGNRAGHRTGSRSPPRRAHRARPDAGAGRMSAAGPSRGANRAPQCEARRREPLPARGHMRWKSAFEATACRRRAALRAAVDGAAPLAGRCCCSRRSCRCSRSYRCGSPASARRWSWSAFPAALRRDARPSECPAGCDCRRGCSALLALATAVGDPPVARLFRRPRSLRRVPVRADRHQVSRDAQRCATAR